MTKACVCNYWDSESGNPHYRWMMTQVKMGKLLLYVKYIILLIESVYVAISVAELALQISPAWTLTCVHVSIGPCSVGNGGCSQLCLPKMNSSSDRTCVCSLGYDLAKDNFTCLQRMRLFLLRGQDNEILFFIISILLLCKVGMITLKITIQSSWTLF